MPEQFKKTIDLQDNEQEIMDPWDKLVREHSEPSTTSKHIGG